jgi:hypothetical protein
MGDKNKPPTLLGQLCCQHIPEDCITVDVFALLICGNFLKLLKPDVTLLQA